MTKLVCWLGFLYEDNPDTLELQVDTNKFGYTDKEWESLSDWGKKDIVNDEIFKTLNTGFYELKGDLEE